MGYQASPSTLAIALACSTTLMKRFARTLQEYMEHAASTRASARADCVAHLRTLSQIAEAVVGANEMRKQNVLQLLLGTLESAARKVDFGVGVSVVEVLEAILAHEQIERLALAELRAFNGLERLLKARRTFAGMMNGGEPNVEAAEVTRSTLLHKLAALTRTLKETGDRLVLVHSCSPTASSSVIDGVQLVQRSAPTANVFFIDDGYAAHTGTDHESSIDWGFVLEQTLLIDWVLVVLDPSCMEPVGLIAADIRRLALQLQLSSPSPMVVVAVAARTLHEPLQETGLPAFFPYEAPDEVPAEPQIRLLPSVLHHATMLEDVAASLTEHAELDDRGVHKQVLKTHYRPVVAHLPALQTELKPPSVASDQSDMSASPTPQTPGREVWADSAPADASTRERVSRAGAESAGSNDEDDRFDWAIKQLHTFKNNRTKRPLHWGTHDATAEAIP
jgi:hypothetical protein